MNTNKESTFLSKPISWKQLTEQSKGGIEHGELIIIGTGSGRRLSLQETYDELQRQAFDSAEYSRKLRALLLEIIETGSGSLACDIEADYQGTERCTLTIMQKQLERGLEEIGPRKY